jgi:hypothetical protein
LPRACALAVAVLGFLPIANWVPGGHAAEWYRAVASEWLSGSAVALGVAVVAFVILRRFDWWPGRGWGPRVAAMAAESPVASALILSVVVGALYGLVAHRVFDARPLLIDEIVQVMQARIMAQGRAALAAAEYPEFFSALHVVDVNGRVFSQFPPGGPLMLLPGVLIGAPWIMGPLWGALSAALYWALVRNVEPRPTVALGAAMLFALAPFTVFMAGSHMNHVPTLTWLCVGLWSLQRVGRSESAVPGFAFVAGLAFGMMALVRPVDGGAFAVPAAVWLLARMRRVPDAWREVVASGVAIAICLAGLLAYNALTTGQPLLFGYELLWGRSHGLGFHDAPWGVTHTPARGLELVNLFFLRLQTYLFETPLPSLVPVVVALALTPGVRGFDRYLLWSSALLVVGYFAYWHDGFFLGPRFFYLLLPALALWTARLPSLVRERVPRMAGGDRFVLLAYAASALVALGVSIPVRARQYAGGLTSMRHDYLAPARDAGIENALVLVRESWGAQLMARLWGLGVSRSEAETFYRSVDACILEEQVATLERRGIRDAAAVAALTPLLRDSSRVIESQLSPDRTERVLPGQTYGPVCVRRLLEDRAGYTFLAPLLAVNHGSNVYARDLHARDTLLLRAFPTRPVYLLRAASSDVGAPLVLVPLAVDSARAEWGAASPADVARTPDR